MSTMQSNCAAGSRAAPAGVDNKEWARKILARHERGDKSLSALQLAFAREALGLAKVAA